MIALLVGYGLIFAGAAGVVWTFWRAATEQDRDRAAIADFIARDRASREDDPFPHAPTVNRDWT